MVYNISHSHITHEYLILQGHITKTQPPGHFLSHLNQSLHALMTLLHLGSRQFPASCFVPRRHNFLSSGYRIPTSLRPKIPCTCYNGYATTSARSG